VSASKFILQHHHPPAPAHYCPISLPLHWAKVELIALPATTSKLRLYRLLR
jgi:hypothetical protein